MTKTGKSSVLILGILAIVFLALAAVSFYLEEQERHQRLRLESQVASLTRAKDQLDAEIKTAREEKSRLEQDVAAAQDEAKQLTSKLNEATQGRDQLQKDLAARDQNLDALTSELRQIQQEREQLAKQLNKVQEQAKRFEDQLSQLKKDRTSLESRLDSLKGQPPVELEKVIVTSGDEAGSATPASPTAAKPPTPLKSDAAGPVTGRVLVVNRDYDFVVMNIGKVNGVNIGDEFEVLRDSQSLGRVKVEKIYEALSAAALQPGTDKQKLHEGDAVRSVGGRS